MAKIPEHAKNVFTGEIFEVYQWPQKMYDGSVATFERIKRPDTCEAFVVVGDKIVIQKQQQPDREEMFYSLVGGRIEKGEDPLEAAKRETLEETGYGSDTWELLRVTEPHTKVEWSIYVYVAREAKKMAEPSLDAGEKIDLLFLSLEKLIALVDAGELRNMDQEIRVELIRAHYDPEAKKKWERILFNK